MEVDRSKSFSKMTKTLLSVLFDRATLQRSSLAGKGNGDMLDSGKTKLITGDHEFLLSISFKCR